VHIFSEELLLPKLIQICLGNWNKWRAELYTDWTRRELKCDFVETDKGFFYLYGQGPFPLSPPPLTPSFHASLDFSFFKGVYIIPLPLPWLFNAICLFLCLSQPSHADSFQDTGIQIVCECVQSKDPLCVCVLVRSSVVASTSKLKPESLHSLELPYKSNELYCRGNTHIRVHMWLKR